MLTVRQKRAVKNEQKAREHKKYFFDREFQANQSYLGIPQGWEKGSRLSLYTPSWSGTQFCAQARPELIIPLPTHVVPAQCKTLKVIKKDELKSS